MRCASLPTGTPWIYLINSYQSTSESYQQHLALISLYTLEIVTQPGLD